MKRNRFLSFFLAGLMLFSFLSVFPNDSFRLLSTIVANASSGADSITAIALSEEGYAEGSNNDNKYGKWYGSNNVAWCAIFISWCANQAGIPENIIKKMHGLVIWEINQEQVILVVHIIPKVLSLQK